MPHSPYHLARRLGVRVVEVPDLDEPVLYFDEVNVALVRESLTAQSQEEVADWLLSVLATPSDAWRAA
jgi:hypothetical protein